VYLDSILSHDLYFAGSVERRAWELEEMFSRPDIRAVLCARGGYGANYLPPVLNPEKIASNPKIFIGYSDVTTLLTCFCDNGNFVSFHGPMATKDFAIEDGIDFASWNAALTGANEWEIADARASGLLDGSAEGVLYGGCLSMLVATLGTPHEIQTGNRILFIEDVATKPFQIDRMLMQLKLAGKLEQVRGFVFGEMVDCRQSPDQPYTLQEVILRVVGDLGVPVAFGLPSGHVSARNITLPLGIRAALNVRGTQVRLRFLEPATLA
jgi:muramoyltetrapeptide carboxypeptidase